MRTTDRPTRRHRARVATLAAALLALTALAAPAAMGATSEQQQGAQLLGMLQSGKASCASLSTTNFERIGEYVMGRMLGSSAAHDAMNRQITLMMGATGETQAHTFMGQRFAGCATGQAPPAFGAMMGMMGAGMMGSAYGGTGSPTMMGSGNRGTGGMMGFGYVTPTASRNSGWGSGDTVMVILMGLLVALAVGALIAWRPWRRPGTPLATLQARLARGDIDQQEFDRRREALGGTA
jgi:Short C-terminal domain